MNKDISWTKGTTSTDGSVVQGTKLTAYRFREGIERFFITDINNPAATALAQSTLAIQWDTVSEDVSAFNHVPGGANVLFMDGHVEYLRYTSAKGAGTFPASREWAEIAKLGASPP
jgi:prepilin-type processing-associated H-X9-DG protein